MKRFIFIAFLIHCTVLLWAQKPTLDTSIYGKWPSAGDGRISDDGRFVSYTIKNQPIGGNTLVMQATSAHWEVEIPNPLSYEIAKAGRLAIFMNDHDSLGVLKLGTSVIEYITHVKSFKLSGNKNEEQLAYIQYTPDGDKLSVRNLNTGKENSFTGIIDYLFTDNGQALLLLKTEKSDTLGMQYLNWLNLKNSRMNIIWKGRGIGNISTNKDGKLIAFIAEDEGRHPILWYYTVEKNKAEALIQSDNTGIGKDFRIDNIVHFSNDNKRLFVTLRKDEEILNRDPNAVKVDIWSYNDIKLQSEQLGELGTMGGPPSASYFMAVVDVDSRRIIRLEEEQEQILESFSPGKNDSLVLVLHRNSDMGQGEQEWNPGARLSYYVISAINGERKKMRMPKNAINVQMSPDGKYVIYYAPDQRNYFTYAILSDTSHNITGSIPATWISDHLQDEVRSSFLNIGVAGWQEKDVAVLIYDQHDIWQVDPAGINAPINVTNGYGRKHNIELRLAMNYYGRSIANKENLILTAFNLNNKDNGYFSKTLNKSGDPILLTMGPYFYNGPYNHPHIPYNHSHLQKSLQPEGYLVKRMSTKESPNYFYTTDFKHFTALSNIHPEKKYNWLSSELMRWKQLDSTSSDGILYKPENFDPQKKYPVILYYYERLSDKLNFYQQPEPADGPINIPWFVSNGYLVFTPDIHYKIGQPGESAYNAIVSAAEYLARFPWVDANKIGLQGHSWGGYETNYVIAHTNLFAAAMSAAGPSDFISAYGSLSGEGNCSQSFYETDQPRMGATLWQDPDLFISNSPIFRADKISTPLLLMNNKEDGNVPFSQGVEFFTALRRLGKKVWMLQYDGEGHVLSDEKVKKDYTARLIQFFDHYLKGKTVPKWMNEGIPARKKGVETGLGI